MDRGIKDEAFVRRALSLADGDTGRWVANQSYFNHYDSDFIDAKLKAAIITAASIYSVENKLEEKAVEDALDIQTYGDARCFIDKYHEFTYKP